MTELESEDEGDEHGYEERDFGDLDDDDFELDGRNYDITFLKWHESAEEIEFELDKCLKPSEFVSLKIGNETYTTPDRTDNSDSACETDRDQDQEFEFDETSNPLKSGKTYDIEIKLRSASTTTSTGCTVTPLVALSGTVTRSVSNRP